MYGTAEDMYYVKLYLLLPLVLTAFERDKNLATTTFKTPEPYLNTIEHAMRSVEKDLKEVRAYFRQKGIKVYKESRHLKGVHAQYLCRGYHCEMNLLSEMVATECRVLMEKYLGLDIGKYRNKNIPTDLQEFSMYQ